MYKNSIEYKASLLLACLFASCILGGCHNRIYSSPHPKVHFEQASTKSAKQANLKRIMHDYTFRSKDMHHVIQSDFYFIRTLSDDVPRTTPKRSWLSGYKFIPYYNFDNRDDTVEANQSTFAISDTKHPDSNHILNYYIKYSTPSAHELKFKEAYSDELASDKATKGLFKRENPSFIKQIVYKLHSISKSSTKPKHLKLVFYPTKEIYTNNKAHDISKNTRKNYPLRLITHTKRHFKSHKKSTKRVHHHTKHPGELPD